MTHLHSRTQWNLGPPRVRYEDAALDVAIASRPISQPWTSLLPLFRRVGRRQRGCTPGSTPACAHHDEPGWRVSSRTWPQGLLGARARVPGPRRRADGLPCAERQPRATATLGVVYRDVEYETLIVELDGRLFHDSAAQRDRDMDRDLDAAVDSRTTIRLGYGQVFDRPCDTALRLEALLRQRGWRGAGTPCAVDCPLGPSGRSLTVTQ